MTIYLHPRRRTFRLNSNHFIESVRSLLTATGWPSADLSYIVAVSGGPDSVSLLHSIKTLCDEVAIENRPSILVAHFEHGLRGEASLADAKFVEELAREWGFQFNLGHGKPETNLSAISETWAREARHKFFSSLRSDRFKDAYLVLGHHQDDLVETILINLSRGTGLAGLAAMPAVDRRLNIVRPLMDLNRRDVITYCELEGLSYCNDESNKSPDTWRNALRINLIPELESLFGSGLSKRIAQTHDILSAENQFMENEAVKVFEHHVSLLLSDEDDLLYYYLNTEKFSKFHQAIRRRLCHKLLAGSLNDMALISYDTVLRLEDVIMSENDRSSDFVGGLKGIKQGNYFRLFNKEKVSLYQGRVRIPFYQRGSSEAQWRTIYLLGNKAMQVVDFSSLSSFHISRVESRLPIEAEKKYNAAYMIINNERMKKIEARTRRTGDQLHFGSGEGSFHKSLKKYLQEQNIWPELRDKLLLFGEEDSIYWIPGVISLDNDLLRSEQDELTRICFMC